MKQSEYCVIFQHNGCSSNVFISAEWEPFSSVAADEEISLGKTVKRSCSVIFHVLSLKTMQIQSQCNWKHMRVIPLTARQTTNHLKNSQGSMWLIMGHEKILEFVVICANYISLGFHLQCRADSSKF